MWMHLLPTLLHDTLRGAAVVQTPRVRILKVPSPKPNLGNRTRKMKVVKLPRQGLGLQMAARTERSAASSLTTHQSIFQHP